jgi:predicted PurR-regulated permease PerM
MPTELPIWVSLALIIRSGPHGLAPRRAAHVPGHSPPKAVIGMYRQGQHLPMSEQRVVVVPSRKDPVPPEVGHEIPLPRDARSFMLAGIFAFLLFVALYVGREIFLPIAFAAMLRLLLTPPMRVLTKLHVPKIVAALVLILGVVCTPVLIGFSVSGPAAEWIDRAPQSLGRIETRLTVLKRPFDELRRATQQVERITDNRSPGTTEPVTVKGPSLSDYLFSGTRAFVAGLVTMVILLFFLLIAGDLFLRRLVEILPSFGDKKQAVEISNEVERNISLYLFTITMMNCLVGIATAAAVHFCGVSDPELWGVVAFLLNYIPILGPLCGVVLFFIVGVLTFDTLWQAALPAALYLVIHLIEGEGVTPMLLARRFTLNPVLVIFSLVFWHWMWGVPGMFLAVPMLAAFKIVCDRVRPLMALGHFLGG